LNSFERETFHAVNTPIRKQQLAHKGFVRSGRPAGSAASGGLFVETEAVQHAGNWQNGRFFIGVLTGKKDEDLFDS
jgi:hypothetical protein